MVTYITGYVYTRLRAMALLSIYRVCEAFCVCYYNKTLNFSHNSYCINGMSMKLFHTALTVYSVECAFVLKRNIFNFLIYFFFFCINVFCVKCAFRIHFSLIRRHNVTDYTHKRNTMITMRLLAFVYYAESTCLIFYTFLFRVFSSLLGGMGASIALLNEQDSFSCVFTPVVFHFYMHSCINGVLCGVCFRVKKKYF
jgi:hypothetical protein